MSTWILSASHKNVLNATATLNAKRTTIKSYMYVQTANINTLRKSDEN